MRFCKASWPSGFVPAQDKQYLIGFAQLPDGATLDRTEDVIREMSTIALKKLTKCFGSFVAVRNVDLDVTAGEVGEIPGAALIESNMLDRRVGIAL